VYLRIVIPNPDTNASIDGVTSVCIDELTGEAS
jgi:hypothetical protein